MKSLVYAAVAVSIATSVMGQETDVATSSRTSPVSPTVAEEQSAAALTAEEIVNTVCGLREVRLSGRAQAVCEGTEPAPKLVKDGSRLSSRGVGSEFQVLWNNRDAF